MVPKPHTPFQWVAMEPPKTISRKLDFLKREINQLGSIKVGSASARLAHQEAAFARGDRRLGKVILRTRKRRIMESSLPSTRINATLLRNTPTSTP